jgi:hypothetical protein
MKFLLAAAALTAAVVTLPLPAVAQSAPKVQAGDSVCVMRWGVRRDRGYCGKVAEVKDGKVQIGVTEIKAPRLGGRGNSCSQGKNLKSLRKDDKLTVPATCVTTKM